MHTSAIVVLSFTLLFSWAAMASEPAPLAAVKKIDLNRYAGIWYEVARYPNRFQRNCQSDTTAEYILREDGKVQIVNTCREADGRIKQARGTAKVVDSSNAKLKVTFFWPFYGDYWVIGLDPDYRYAIVGEPKRRYLWILSRSPEMNDNDYKSVIEQIRAAGYDANLLIKTPHSREHPSSGNTK